MKLSYRQIENVLTALHNIDPRHRGALQARVRHFQRNGWPGETNTGRGRAASYGLNQLLKLCVGFELVEIGLNPDRAVAILHRNWYAVLKATSWAIARFHERDPSIFGDVFVYCDPNALNGLANVASGNDAVPPFWLLSGESLSAMLRLRSKRRLAIINISALLDDLMFHLFAENGTTATDFLAAQRLLEKTKFPQYREQYLLEHGKDLDMDHPELSGITLSPSAPDESRSSLGGQ